MQSINAASAAKMPKVLIVTYNFLPYFSSYGGVARCTNLYAFLKQKGYEVKIVAANGIEFSWFGKEDLFDKEDLIYVRSQLNRIHGVIRTPRVDLSTKSHFRSIKQIIGATARAMHKLLIPDYSVIDSEKFRRTITPMIEAKGFKNIIISAPKHGISIIAPALKRRFGERVNLILDYRDSWNTSAIFEPQNTVLKAISHAMERRILTSVDHLTYVSPPVPELIEKKFGIRPISTMIMNGFEGERSMPAPVVRSTEGKRLLYFGAATDRQGSYRDISNLINICENHGALRLDIYGDLELVRHKIDNLRTVRYRGSVSPDMSARVFKSYDWGIVLHTDPASATEVIPGKVFDYIRHSLPILCIAPENAEVRKLINREQIGVSIGPDLTSLTHGIGALFDKELINRILERYGQGDFDRFSRRAQLELFTELFR